MIRALLALVGLSLSISTSYQIGVVHEVKTAPGKLSVPQIALEPVIITGLTSPTYVANAGDGSNRLFIVEQTGFIKVLQPGSTIPTVFLDLHTKVAFIEERGLLGLAFHPQYATNRRFFVYYTRNTDGAIVIAEYLVSSSNPNFADTTEKVILTIAHPFPIHNGGMIEFGPDNFLYIAVGDGGGFPGPDNPAQDKDVFLGKILRIDVDNPESPTKPYSCPASNPFFGSIPGRDEVYALGLRNPWRFSFDRVTGQIYAADVGQGQREEIDIITLGGNYGWSAVEGTLCNDTQPELCPSADLTPPLAQYSHANGGCSIIGGYVYRGTKSTLPLGSYVYGDYCTGEIFLLEPGAQQSLLLDTSLAISSFGEDESGEIYVTGLGGTLYRITDAPKGVSLTIQMSKDTYVFGDLVTATEFRMENSGTESARVELKVWLKVPGVPLISVLNLGSDGSFALAPGVNQNLGPITLLAVIPSTPRGNYEFNSRMVNHVTGKLVTEDINTFVIQ